MPPRSSRSGTAPAPRRQPKHGAAPAADAPFWERIPLEDLNAEQWESLCDRCGRCCLVKLEDEDTGEIHKTDIGCKLFDAELCTCAAYATRQRKVKDCIKLTPQNVRSIPWLPSTCAYRRVAEGRRLEAWHPLISGSPESVHEAGISMRGRVSASEKTVKLRDYVDHIVDWDD